MGHETDSIDFPYHSGTNWVNPLHVPEKSRLFGQKKKTCGVYGPVLSQGYGFLHAPGGLCGMATFCLNDWMSDCHCQQLSSKWPPSYLMTLVVPSFVQVLMNKITLWILGDPGFPRGGANLLRRCQPTIWPIFPKNCIRMKKFWPRRRGVPLAPLDPPLVMLVNGQPTERSLLWLVMLKFIICIIICKGNKPAWRSGWKCIILLKTLEIL